MTDQEFANKYTTISGAMKMLNYKSKNSIEYQIKKRRIKIVWIDQKLRLLNKNDIIKLK